ncbi:MAG: Ig-like domain-containing protein [Myxococcales bacterium]|nr:Ig-like domain-containing protein [Myxococcales bacterium]
MLRLVPLLLIAACARPDHIEIDPRAPRLVRKGESLHLHAKMMDRGGNVFPRERAAWKSRDPFVAGVTGNGDVTGLSSGHTVLTATWNELSAEVPLEVDLVEALQIEPGTLELLASADPVKINVVALGLDGHPLRDREVHLVSANPAVARVDPEGRVWPVAPGFVTVRANIDDKEGEIAVHVLNTGPSR